MKKLIIILLIFICFNVYSIDWFNFNGYFEFGIIPKGHLAQYEHNNDVYPNLSFYGDTYIEFTFIDNIIFTGINTKIYIWKTKDTYDFHPDYIHFMFIAGLRYKFFEFGFRHYCEHPIVAWINSYNSSNWERWYEELYIKFNF